MERRSNPSQQTEEILIFTSSSPARKNSAPWATLVQFYEGWVTQTIRFIIFSPKTFWNLKRANVEQRWNFITLEDICCRVKLSSVNGTLQIGFPLFFNLFYTNYCDSNFYKWNLISDWQFEMIFSRSSYVEIKKIKKMDDPRLVIGRLPAVRAVQGHRWIQIIRAITTTIQRLFHRWRNDIRGSFNIRSDLFLRKWTWIRHFPVTIAAPQLHPASTERMKTATITTNSTWKPVPSTVATPRATTPPSTSTAA